MNHILPAPHILGLALLGAFAVAAAGREVTINGRTLTVADGYDVELVAGPPLVERPIAVAADEQGRLYVTDSGGMTEKAEKQLEAKPHRVRRVTASKGDGRYDQSELFAERLMFPEGCLWFDGSLYVAAPPQIWRLTPGANGGPATREVWYDGKTLTGCGNDLHGPYLGRDGWLYWCKGAFAEQHHTLGSGKQLVTRASHIFRARPDGSGREPVLTGGMDNAVGVTFLSTGERILSCTFFVTPAAGQRDGLIHAIYGGLYGKPHDVLQGHIATGSLMPLMVHEGAAAPCGIIAGSASLFGGGHEDNLFVCYFNLHKVVRHELTPDGATFTTKDTDLLACEHPDFHPTDVFEDADGSLLVVDTGGWYKVCCPTSVLAKPDVLGAIYRVRKQGAPKVFDPYGVDLPWSEMSRTEVAALLADPRLFVRRRAAAVLRNAGERSVLELSHVNLTYTTPAARREAVWAMAAIDAPRIRTALRISLNDGNRSVAAAAIHAVGLQRDRRSLESLARIVGDDDAALARAAAEALGRIGDVGAVPALLAAIQRLGPYEPDASGAPAAAPVRVLEHSLIYALIEIGDPAAVAPGLSSPSVNVRRAALVALDQMSGDTLRPGDVLPLLGHEDARLRRTAAWVVAHRPQWGEALAEHFRACLLHPPATDVAQNELAAQLGQLATSPAIQDVLTASLRESHDARTVRVSLDAMAAAPLAASPPAWLDELARVLPDLPAPLLPSAVAAARALPKPKGGHPALTAALLQVARHRELPTTLRVDALQAAGNLKQLDAELFADLLSMVRPAEAMDVRRGAAAVLVGAALSADQQFALADAMRGVGPLELPRLVPAFERAKPSDELGTRLLAALKASKGRRSLRADLLKPVLARFSPAVQQAGAALLAELNTSEAEQAAHLDVLVKELPAGDVRRGQEVFVSKKVACISCHTIGYNGGRLGPDLSTIGKVRTERDLLEAIVYPSASFVRGYEPVIIKLRDGNEPLNGIIASESRTELVLNTGPQETRRVPWTNVAELRPSPLSLMPDGFETILTRQELADVVAFLKQRTTR